MIQQDPPLRTQRPSVSLVPVTPVFCFVLFCFLCSQTQLLRTSEDVAKMQEELEIMRPLLEEAAKDTMLTMDQIKVGVLSESS